MSLEQMFVDEVGQTILRTPPPPNSHCISPHLDPMLSMTRFRPCIDLHSGQVKQIVGGTLRQENSALKTNHVSSLPASHFAQLYKDNALEGAHIIMLGPGNEDAAQEALNAWPGALQIGGGINDQNAKGWIERGAGKVGLM